MPVKIRAADDADVEALRDLVVRTWEPVFDSMEAVLGARISKLLTPDWRAAQRDAVVEFCGDQKHEVAVAEIGDRPVGFVAYRLEPDDRATGVVEIIGVDPASQGRGVGRELLAHAVDQLKTMGARVVMVETGGDGGHAAARGLYESSGFVQLPIARYFLDVR